MQLDSTLTLGRCPVCGKHLARVFRVTDGFKVSCDPDQGGCGAEAARGVTPGDAADRWNGARNAVLAFHLIAAAKRRLERLPA